MASPSFRGLPGKPKAAWPRNPAFHKLVRKVKRAVLLDEPGYYDMFLNEGERFFARLYLHEIRNAIREAGLKTPLKILDAGCQTGRLAIPLAKEGHHVTGVDTSRLALHKASQHAKEEGARLRLVRADLSSWLPKQPAGSFDLVLCAEVLYLRSNYRELLQGLLRLTRSGGLCVVSHRPAAYYLAEALQHGDKEAAERVKNSREGTLFGSYYNWQEPEDLKRLYREMNVELLKIAPIGFLSWRGIRLDGLTPEEQEKLFQQEIAPREHPADSGRYLLAVARKP